MNKPQKRFFNGGGFWWFLEASIYYINPKGFDGWVYFIKDFPGAYLHFRKLMKEDENGDDS